MFMIAPFVSNDYELVKSIAITNRSIIADKPQDKVPVAVVNYLYQVEIDGKNAYDLIKGKENGKTHTDRN